MSSHRLFSALLTLAAYVQSCFAQVSFDAAILANVSSGEFAPYFIGALNHGKITQKDAALIDLTGTYSFSPIPKLTVSAGAEVLTGASARTDYLRWHPSAERWAYNPQGPAAIWLQQLYADFRYRSLFISAGLKEHGPAMLNPLLSSGDLVYSGNARPIPGLWGGLNRFVSIPFTEHWVQVEAVLSYGWLADSRYMDNHYNYYNYHLASGSSFCYRRVFFRSNPYQRLVVVAGMQAASMFGGSAEFYDKGTLIGKKSYEGGLKSFFKMVIPVFSQTEDFVQGSTLGTWDFKAQYRLTDTDRISAYFQWPFEDGSGIALRNKLDGLWGIEYKTDSHRLISGAVLEYIDLRDQSGPIHFAPGDHLNPSITTGVTGRDNYYNNSNYNAYAYYGMSMGTPVLKSPLYNLNGYPAFECNRVNGFHIGLLGNISDGLRYRLLGGYKRGLGTYSNPYKNARTSTSIMAELTYTFTEYLQAAIQIAGDMGDYLGNNFGGLISLRYTYK